ncbi:alpha/beta hydrolase [Candidatus Saccharibacteria bacterium]|nr:alpha/beta hydrolase [Candidatus Saccharibacteria bacterium]
MNQRSPKDKPTLLLVHGFRGSHIGLETLANEFKKLGYNTVVPDLPPWGEAGAMTEYTPDSYAKYLAEFIRRKKLVRPICVGQSMGTMVVAATAERYPDLIDRRLILVAPISAKPKRFVAMLSPLLTILPNKMIGYISTHYLQVDQDKATLRRTLDVTYRCAAKHSSRRDVFKASHFSTGFELGDFKLRSQFQLYFIAGDSDKLFPATKTKACYNLFKLRHKTCRLDFIERTGHLVNCEKPEVIAKLSDDFLRAS